MAATHCNEQEDVGIKCAVGAEEAATESAVSMQTRPEAAALPEAATTEANAAEATEAGANATEEGDASDGAPKVADAATPKPPFSWAQRAERAAAAQAAAAAAAEEAATATPPAPAGVALGGCGCAAGVPAPAPVPRRPECPRDTIVDYLIFLAEQKASARAAPAPDDGAGVAAGEGAGAGPGESEGGGSAEGSAENGEALPPQLRKHCDCLRGGVASGAQVNYSRLGLRNDANNCYANAAIQALLPCSALTWVLRRCALLDPSRPFLSCLVSLCREFHTRGADTHGEIFNPLVVPQVLDVITTWQKLGAQQDAGEFLFYVLDGAHNECKWAVPSVVEEEKSGSAAAAAADTASEAIGGGGWAQLVKTSRRQVETRAAGLQEDSPIMRIFGGLIQSAVRAKSAKADSVSLEPFNRLDLDISQSGVASVKSALEAFCRPEAVSSSEGQVTRRVTFRKLPGVLVLNLKRFTYNSLAGGAIKLKKAIKYEEKLVFDATWLAAGCQAREYYVTALICHIGDAAVRGHYTAYVRYNNEWYSYDDTTIRRVETHEVAAQQHTAYILVYQARGVIDMAP